MTPDEAVLIPIVGMMIPIVIVPAALMVKYLRSRREMLHRERMRALEMGQPAPGASTWPVAVAALGIGAGVPVGCFLVAWLSALTTGAEIEVFVIAMIVGLVAIIQATRLAIRLASTSAAPDPRANGKPMVLDPDAYDVVGRRG